jgi:hypothetical protein
MSPLVIFLIILVIIAVTVGALYAAGIIGESPAPPPSKGLAPSPSPAAPAPSPSAYSGPSYASTQTPVNCQVSEWSDSGSCSVTMCGATGGTKTQTRTITTPVANGGTACPALTQTVPCNGPTCVTCTGGMELNRATNTCLLSQQQIATNLQQTYGINVPTYNPPTTPPGGVDCQVSGWTPGCPDPATLPCSGSMITQTRTVTQQPQNGGVACPPLTQQTGCPGTCTQAYTSTQQTTNPSGSFCDPNPCDSNSACMDFGNGQGMCQDQG